MKKNIFIGFTLVVCLTFSGCASVTELTKTIFGVSTKKLEEARGEAIKKTYQCEFDDCFDAVIKMARSVSYKMFDSEDETSDESNDPLNTQIKGQEIFEIFSSNRERRQVVVMGIPGNVDTTEVGIFFSRHSRDAYTVEIASLSGSAKRKVARAVFDQLDLLFNSK